MQAKPQDFVVYGFVKNAPQLSRRGSEGAMAITTSCALALEK